MKRVNAVTVIALTVFSLIVIPRQEAQACSCIDITSAHTFKFIEDLGGRVDVIFEGVATETIDTFQNDVPVPFQVSAVYRGDVALGSVVGVQGDSGFAGACGGHQKFYQGHVYSFFVEPVEQSSSTDFSSGCGKNIIGPINHEKFGLPEPRRWITGTADATPAPSWPPIAIATALIAGTLIGAAALIRKRSR